MSQLIKSIFNSEKNIMLCRDQLLSSSKMEWMTIAAALCNSKDTTQYLNIMIVGLWYYSLCVDILFILNIISLNIFS